ncbi:lytic transglycosylase domain-containing protein [Candidatus Pacearchaeota archaeon]|nr:lytic transglycosylase domain-containing protein [Candidatus Pacearchaeota archaeon]
MKKTTKTIKYVLALSLVGNLAPLENNFSLPNENSLEKKVLECYSEIPNPVGQNSTAKRNYSEDEILKTINNVYNCLPSKPEYFSEKFIKEMVKKESSYNPRSVSEKGALGLMQIMPETWKEQTKRLYRRELSFDLAFNPKTNLEVGLSYLLWIDEFSKNRYQNWESLSDKEKREKVMAAYHGGISRLYSLNGNINDMPRATRDYIKTIEAGMEVND